MFRFVGPLIVCLPRGRLAVVEIGLASSRHQLQLNYIVGGGGNNCRWYCDVTSYAGIMYINNQINIHTFIVGLQMSVRFVPCLSFVLEECMAQV